MGRMADARKRARRSGEGERKSIPVPGEPDAPRETLAPSEPGAPRGHDVPSATGAAAAPAPERKQTLDGARLELPSSGLAADVLARMDAAAVPAEASPATTAPRDAPVEPGVVSPAAAQAGGHSLSFFAAPAQEQRAAAEATEHLATFFLEGEEYGVDVRQVQEIRRVGEITAVPRAPGYVRGVINLRGRILPVLDLKRKLGLGEVAVGRAARIVVVRVRERLLGLLVDGASQVLKVPVSRVEAAPDEVTERGGDYIRGVAKLDDRLIILIDLARALAQEIGEAGVVAGT